MLPAIAERYTTTCKSIERYSRAWAEGSTPFYFVRQATGRSAGASLGDPALFLCVAQNHQDIDAFLFFGPTCITVGDPPEVMAHRFQVLIFECGKGRHGAIY